MICQKSKLSIMMAVVLGVLTGGAASLSLNTAMLPTRDLAEYPEIGSGERKDLWETVFTNRDALHAAISDDEGRTWKGFRELALNEIRNAADLREFRMATGG